MSGRLERVTHVATAPALELVEGVSVVFFANGELGATASVLAWLASNLRRSCLAISTNAANRLRCYRENVTLPSKDEPIGLAPCDSIHVPAGMAHGSEESRTFQRFPGACGFLVATVTRNL
jgi:hypothetical protein